MLDVENTCIRMRACGKHTNRTMREPPPTEQTSGVVGKRGVLAQPEIPLFFTTSPATPEG